MIRSRGTDSTVDPAYLADAPKVTTFIEELPSVTVEDNGKVLSVVDGAWDKAEPVEELPAVTAENNGEVLTVVEGVWGKAAPVEELPAVTSDDNGKVLSVVDGEWNKSTPSKELPSVTSDDNGKVLSVVEGEWSKVSTKTPVTDLTTAYNPTGTLTIVRNATYVEDGVCHILVEMNISADTQFAKQQGTINLLNGLPKAAAHGVLVLTTNVGYFKPVVQNESGGYYAGNGLPISIYTGGFDDASLHIQFSQDVNTYTVESNYTNFYVEGQYFVATT